MSRSHTRKLESVAAHGLSESPQSSTVMSLQLPILTMDEVARHSAPDDMWIVIDGRVLDVTNFLQEHPGGTKVMLMHGGTDATTAFSAIHEPSVLEKYADRLVIGLLPNYNQLPKVQSSLTAPTPWPVPWA